MHILCCFALLCSLLTIDYVLFCVDQRRNPMDAMAHLLVRVPGLLLFATGELGYISNISL